MLGIVSLGVCFGRSLPGLVLAVFGFDGLLGRHSAVCLVCFVFGLVLC